ncbi:uncharacterized protein LOC111245980 [Varroa destructor]|uniref:Uncharacterized protein n=1 Tax=Varroa destructor TaxID=109461 RepID=A0A7M7JTA7_VARDE|nr:uncharacterized protein LOC111245980 [Varroa destructor]
MAGFTGSYTNQVAHIENCHLDVFVSTMRIIEWYSIAVQFFLLCMMADPARRPPKKPKGPKAINWNSSYYQTSFDPCKPLREFNPVELVKARKYATEIFARCGSKLVVYFATKYDFPAFGLVNLARHACVLLNMGYAFYSPFDNSLVASPNTTTDEAVVLLKKFINGFMNQNYSFVIRHRQQKYTVLPYMLLHFYECGLRCVFNTKKLFPLDGDLIKLVGFVPKRWVLLTGPGYATKQ